MDKLFIKNLHLQTVIGVYPHERNAPQELIINVTLFTDTRAAGRSDDLTDAVNYAAVAERITQYSPTTAPKLLEKLANDLADMILREFTAVSRIRLHIEKPAALHPLAQAAAIEIERSR